MMRDNRGQKPQTWFDWAEALVSERRTASSKRWDGYSASSIVVLTESERAARSLGCDAIGVEHLLAAFLKCDAGRVSQPLRSVGLSLEMLRKEIEQQWGLGHRAVEYECIPFTPRCKRVVERACERARLESARLVEPEDLFLELLDEKEGLVAELFRKAGVDAAALREAIKF